MFEPFPEDDGFRNADASELARIDGKFELVRAGRFLKASYNLPDGKKVGFYVKAVDADALAFLESQRESLISLLNASELEIGLADYDSAKSGAAPSQLCRLGSIHLPLAGLIDVDAERAKLEKQKKELTGWIAGSKAKLSNERFVSKAPAQVVADAKLKLAEMEEKLARTLDLLNSLK